MISLETVALADEADERAFLDLWIQDFAACAHSAADELELFDALSPSGATAEELAARLGLDPQGVDAVCRALAGLGTLALSGDVFRLGRGAQLFWLKDAPGYRGREFDRHRDWQQHGRMIEMLESGWSPLLDTEEAFSDVWSRGEVSVVSAQNFTRVMHSMILTPSLAAVRSGAFATVRHLVDVGGGSGALAACLLAHQPRAHVTVMDLPPVCTASKQIMSAYSSGAAVAYHPADFFRDAWPADADAFCFSNILHDWPLETCGELLDRAVASLPVGGRIFIQEALLKEDGCSPSTIALFNLLMRMNHRGQQFTRSRLAHLLERSGLERIRVVHDYSYWSLVEASKPAR